MKRITAIAITIAAVLGTSYVGTAGAAQSNYDQVQDARIASNNQQIGKLFTQKADAADLNSEAVARIKNDNALGARVDSTESKILDLKGITDDHGTRITALENQPKPKDGKDGTNGVDGKDGATGATGATGAAGADGKDGAAGRDGVDGKNGLNGRDGVNGKDGKPGAQGLIGAAGRDGVDGRNGIDGKDGAPGAKGDTGATGAAGVNGAVGATGAAGRNGRDGKDVSPAVAKQVQANTNKLRQHDQQIDDLKHDVKGIGNNAAAMSSLHFNGNRDSWAISTGSYNADGAAFAGGLQKSIGDHLATTVQASFDGEGNTMIGAGLHGDF